MAAAMQPLLQRQASQQQDLLNSLGIPHTMAPSDVHVLLVDDERLSRMVVGNVLRKCNYRVSVAESGEEAVSMLRTSPIGTYQLVLTDVMMPDVDGIELLRFLRGNDAFAAVPVVMMSANEQNDTVFECIRGGAEDYLLKPVTRKEVQHIWQHVWRRQQQLLVPSLPDEHDESLQTGDQAPVPTAGAAAEAEATSPIRQDSAQQGQQASSSQEGARKRQRVASHGGSAAQSQPAAAADDLAGTHGAQPGPDGNTGLSAGAVAASSAAAAVVVAKAVQSGSPATPLRRQGSTAPQHMSDALKQAAAAASSELPPSRPMAEFLLAAAGRRGEDSFRVLCQVLGYLRAAHARGRALGRLRPAALRVTSSCIVLLDAAAVIPPEEEALYAAPEESGAARAASVDGGPVVAPRRRPSMSADMFSFGLLLLQLLHPVQQRAPSPSSSQELSPESQQPQQVCPATVQLLQDGRHQILPNALLQGRPTEAALLTGLLSPDPARRPLVDDVLRSGLLRQLHSTLTSRRPPVAGSASSAAALQSQPSQQQLSISRPPSGRLSGEAPRPTAPAQRPSGGALRPPPPKPPLAAAAAQLAPAAQAAAVAPVDAPVAARAVSLGFADGDALQDFLRLARDSVAEEAAAVKRQIAELEADTDVVKGCLAAVAAAAASEVQSEAGGSPTLSLSVPPAPATTSLPQTTSAAAAPSNRKRGRREAGVSVPVSVVQQKQAAAPVQQANAGKVSDSKDDQLSEGSSPFASLVTRASRITVALPAVDTTFFRARAASAAAGTLHQPTQPLVQAPRGGGTGAAAAALQPWRRGLAPGKVDAIARAAQLPGHLASFSRDLDAYSRYGSFRVVANLKWGDGLAAPDMVCSTAFDRNDEFFATAGASRRVKVYEYASLLEEVAAGGGAEGAGAHYPVLDLPFRARLSCVAWNTYLKGHLLAADYDGIATLVDASIGTEVASFAEHMKRVWSVDFSSTDPQRFLSGSDDGTVRLWSINEEKAVAAIDAKANVCSVQFSPSDANIMAFGAANYRTYLYDLRHIQSPLAVISGHSRAVSYVRFMDGGARLLTASTDNALKLWDIAAQVARPSGQPAIADITFTGHANEKNFVGLSVTADGYIATGSEDNSVVAYHSSLPLPVARHSFSPTPAVAAGGVLPQRRPSPPDAAHFVSSVAWTRRGNACVASNSQGHLRVLQLA